MIVISGAGPVGLMLACELQKRGVDYRILETRKNRDYFCKALGVTPRTLEIFDLMGLLDEAVNRGLWMERMNLTVGGELVQSATTEVDMPYGFITLAQYDTEEVLEQFLKEHGGRVEYGRTLKGFEESDGAVACRLEDGETIQADYLVGCDGAHSTVRKGLGLEFSGEKYPMTFVLGDVELEWNEPHAHAWKMVHLVDGEMRNMLVVIPIPGNPRRYRLSMVAEGDEVPANPSLEFLRELAGPILPEGVTIDTLRWSSAYSISHRIVPAYQKGRVFIAGDAAHIHPPIGGLGMNTGLQDAFNLGWKLALVQQGLAAPSLLDTYSEERHKVGSEVVTKTAARMDKAVKAEETDEQAQIREDSQLDISYAGSSLSARGAGRRAPWVEGLTRPRIERSARLVDLLRGGRFHLLATPGGGLLECAALVREHLEDQVRCWCIAPAGETPDLQEQVALVHDSRGQFAAALGTDKAMLVRPDGHVAWQGPLDPESLRSYLASFCRTAPAMA